MAALVALQIVTSKLIPVSLDHSLMTIRVIGALMGDIIHISDVDVLDTSILSEFIGTQECFYWSGLTVVKLKVGMKCRRMQRHFITDVSQNPVTHPEKLVVLIIGSRDDEIGDLELNLGFLMQPLERIQDRLEMRKGQLLIEFISKCLEVNIGGIDVFKERGTRSGRDIACGDGYVLDVAIAVRSSSVDRVFGPDDRFVVRVGDALALMLMSGGGNYLGCCQLT